MTGKVQFDVLVVEDHYPSLYAMRRQLELLGATVHTAENSKEAIALTKENRFDLILMDVLLPRVNGLETTKEIREYEEQNDLPRSKIISISGGGCPRSKCIEAGMDDSFEKPMLMDDMKAVLKKWAPELLGAGG